MRRDPQKAVLVLDATLEYFDGGGARFFARHVPAPLPDRRAAACAGQQRIRGAGTEFYLRAALLSMLDDELDPLIEFVMARLCGHREPGEPNDRDLMDYNDGFSYDEVRDRRRRSARAIGNHDRLCTSALLHADRALTKG